MSKKMGKQLTLYLEDVEGNKVRSLRDLIGSNSVISE